MKRKYSKKSSEETLEEVEKGPVTNDSKKTKRSTIDERDKDFEAGKIHTNNDTGEAFVETGNSTTTAFDEAESDR